MIQQIKLTIQGIPEVLWSCPGEDFGAHEPLSGKLKCRLSSRYHISIFEKSPFRGVTSRNAPFLIFHCIRWSSFSKPSFNQLALIQRNRAISPGCTKTPGPRYLPVPGFPLAYPDHNSFSLLLHRLLLQYLLF